MAGPAAPDSYGIADGVALGSNFRVVTTSPGALDAAREAAASVVRSIDRTCSRFRSDSEIAAVNAAAGSEVVVSPLLATAIEVALRAAWMTRGGPPSRRWGRRRLAGYDADFALVPGDAAAIHLTAARVPGWTVIRLDPRRRMISFPAGVELDLGATAKALAADMAARAAASAAGCGVLISLGGDIAVAGPTPAAGWPIQVAEESTAAISATGETITVRSGGVATSSTTVRRWRRGGIELHHLIDPATGLPAAGPWRSVTTAADSCVNANTASTAVIVMGDTGVDWLRLNRIPGLLVGRDGCTRRVAGWPEPLPGPA